jgi:hypothetical protein
MVISVDWFLSQFTMVNGSFLDEVWFYFNANTQNKTEGRTENPYLIHTVPHSMM